jgi:hypothetical protein
VSKTHFSKIYFSQMYFHACLSGTSLADMHLSRRASHGRDHQRHVSHGRASTGCALRGQCILWALLRSHSRADNRSKEGRRKDGVVGYKRPAKTGVRRLRLTSRPAKVFQFHFHFQLNCNTTQTTTNIDPVHIIVSASAGSIQ